MRPECFLFVFDVGGNQELPCRFMQFVQCFRNSGRTDPAQADFRKITGKYQKLRNITLCSPAEIFILTLKKQQESLGIDIDMEKLRQLLEEVRNGFFIRKIFTHCPHDEIAHNCKKVKKYPFAV